MTKPAALGIEEQRVEVIIDRTTPCERWRRSPPRGRWDVGTSHNHTLDFMFNVEF